MRKLNIIISLIVLILGSISNVSGQTFDLSKDYGVYWNTYTADLSTKYTTATATSKFPFFHSWWITQGKSESDFLKLSEFVCAHNDAIWRAHAAGYTSTCQSRSVVIDPHGKFAIDFPLMVAFGEYHGQGTSAFYYGGTIPQGGTELYIDQSGWVGDPKVRNIFQSNTWGREDLYSYNESFIIDGYRLIGNKPGESYDPTIVSAGIAIWDAGSTSKIGRIFAENFNTSGIYLVRGTPAYVDELTTFRNNLAGVYLQGGGMHYFNLVEADENPTVFYVREGHGRPGATALQVNYIKEETGIAPGRPIAKGQMILDAEGWINAHFSTISYASVGAIPHSMFRINGNVNSSNIKVDNVQLFGPCYAWLQDVKNSKLWLVTAPGGVNLNGYWGTPQHGFEWSSDGAFIPDFGNATSVPCAGNRLDLSPTDPNTGAPTISWNNASGTPIYPWGDRGSAPSTPVSCTGYDIGSWSDCINGKRSRSVTPMPAGCVGNVPTSIPIPTKEELCTIPTQTVKYTIVFGGKNVLSLQGCVPISNSNSWKAGSISGSTISTTSNTSQQFTSPISTSKIILKGCTIKESTDWKFLNDVIRTSGGKFIYNGSTVGSFTVGSKSDITITLPSSIVVSNLLGSSSFNTLLLSVEGIELY